VIVLLTPDEHAVLYDANAGRFDAEDERWQPRPNVIFEAGWSYGSRKDQTVFASLGDVGAFSDIAGHVVTKLDQPPGFNTLCEQLGRILNKSISAPDANPFTKFRGSRPAFHDEVTDLTVALANKDIVRRKSRGRAAASFSVLAVLDKVVRTRPAWDWRYRTPKELVTVIAEQHGDTFADDAFWWLTSFGVFRFSKIDRWGDHWKDEIDHCNFAARGLALIAWVRRQAHSR
jgi:hypothetical protein